MRTGPGGAGIPLDLEAAESDDWGDTAMDRARDRREFRQRTRIALLISLAAHVALLAWASIEIPEVERVRTARPLRLVDLPDSWRESAIEVVPLETAGRAANGGTRGTPAPPEAPEAAPRDALDPEATLAALPRPALSTTVETPGLVTERAATAPATDSAVSSTTPSRPLRGVVLRKGGGDAATSGGARRGEGDRGGGGGIDVSILGGDGCIIAGPDGRVIIGGRGVLEGLSGARGGGIIGRPGRGGSPRILPRPGGR